MSAFLPHGVFTHGATQLEPRLERARKILHGQLVPSDVVGIGADPPRDHYKEAEREFHAVTAELAALNRRDDVWERYKKSRQWIQSLPAGTALDEVVTKPPPDADLAEVLSRIAQMKTDLHTLRTAPMLDPEIREKIEAWGGQ
jgi:hypothetical protein